ncbi:HAD hydrolase-like protein [Clostridium sp. YIM B02505]|uniref:HAD hydrolase-like protein n=1 Tax=Clostridium yunnanense TaxID=2800325 RepID=A0ABS1EPR2_9CLOT|nr:HAD hydrolase-like protein [Clostridium yunnanense]MBK1811293.1 HAD hydrolase-like protein [Clostridium yunnanense]
MKNGYIMFDLDGTLTDSKAGILNGIKFAISQYEIYTIETEKLISCIGSPLRSIFNNFFHLDDKATEKAIDRFHQYYSEIGLYENTIYDGVNNLLERICVNNRLIVATGKSVYYAEAILKHFGLYQYFDCISGSQSQKGITSKSQIINDAITRVHGINTSNSIMVGDRKHDIYAAREIGIKSIGVLYGYGSYKELSNVGADYLVAKVDDLFTILTE